MHVYSKMPAPRRAVNLRIDGELLRQARVLKLNLSQVLDQALRKQVKDARREAWFTASAPAIDAYNRRARQYVALSGWLSSLHRRP
jgi:antitoxin CcdA